MRVSFSPDCGRRACWDVANIFPAWARAGSTAITSCPVIDKPLKKLWAEDLLPYRMLRAQMPLVMISHAAYPLVTKDRTPASLSKVWITDILRKRIGYRGLIVSDDLEMGGVSSAAPVGQAAVGSHSCGRRFVPDLPSRGIHCASLRRTSRDSRARPEVRSARRGISAARAGVQEEISEDPADEAKRHHPQRLKHFRGSCGNSASKCGWKL